MQLRDYQVKAIQQIYEAWNKGARNVIVQLATGAGKTVLFSYIISQEAGHTIAIAHRVELVSQISLTLARYGIRHNLIAQKQARREIVAIHMQEIGCSFYDPQAKVVVAGVDSLLRLDRKTPWFNRITLVVQDEGHHPLKSNKWGTVANFFPNARGLYPTATPIRADGKGLGRHADGIADVIVVGPPMRELIKQGYLSDYRIFAPRSDVDLKSVPLTPSGDYSPPKLKKAVHASHITGDVVSHYLKIAPDKLGVTFAVDIDSATEIAEAYRRQGVKAEVISSKTPDILRSSIMQRFRNREIMQLVNVDLLGEGVDVPAIEVVSMARPTQSYGLYSQQFGRALRPMPGKTHAIIIDHVDNVIRHGLPDAPREWSLDARDKRQRTNSDTIPLRTCPDCLAVYSRFKRTCPECDYYVEPTGRSLPEYVDGDLFELDPGVLANMRGEIERIDGVPYIKMGLSPFVNRAIVKQHHNRQVSQKKLRDNIALWAGHLKAENMEDSEIYRRFYHFAGVDVMTAQTFSRTAAEDLNDKLKLAIDGMDNKR